MNNDAASLPTPIQGLQAGGLNPQAGSNSEHADFRLQRIGELQQLAAGAASAGPPGPAPGAQPVLQRNDSISSQLSSESNQSHPPGNDQTPNFRWATCRNLIATDAAGVLVRQPTIWPAVQLGVQLQLPLLYWAEHNRWMWHKKWTLPKIDVRVTFVGSGNPTPTPTPNPNPNPSPSPSPNPNPNPTPTPNPNPNPNPNQGRSSSCRRPSLLSSPRRPCPR